MDMNLGTLMTQYRGDAQCRACLESLRWKGTVTCLRCGSARISPLPTRHQHHCLECHYQFTVTAGTIFQDSHLPLWKWFAATYMMIESKKSMSANQLKRTLDVSYKTAWYLCHRIRAAMHDANPALLDGIVEVDETYVGGRKRGIGSGNYRDYKTAVIGAVKRGGGVRLKVINKGDKKTLHGFVKNVTKPETEAIYTDENAGYFGIGDDDTRHETVNHSAGEYVRADVHTNAVEGVWSLFKRSIIGAYHQISAKHMDKYLDEQAWRFSGRRNPYLFRDTLLKLLDAKAVPFKQLVNGE